MLTPLPPRFRSFAAIAFASVLVDALQAMNIPLADRANEEHYMTILGAPHQIEGDCMPADVARACKALWRDAGIRAAFKRKNEIQLNDSAQ